MEIGFVSVLVIALTACGAKTNPLRHEPQAISAYAGFAQIDPTKNHFIIVGDTQSTSHWEFWRERNDKERKLIIDAVTKREPAFVIHLGDLTVRGSSKKYWQQFDDLHKEFREKKIPYFPILGNHELYGNDKEALWYYFGHFPYLAQRWWYSFVWNDVAIVLVDSNFSALSEEQIEEQSKWYLTELERFDRDEGIHYIIVCCHEPPFTNSRVVSPNKKVKLYFADPFLRFQKTRLFFSGHSHTYERFRIEGKLFIVSGGGGGPRHKISTDPGATRYTDLFAGPELRFLHFCEIGLSDGAGVLKVMRLDTNGTFSIADSVTLLHW